MSMEKITAVLITREREYPKIVLERIDTGFFDEIIIKTECPSVYGRYLAAKEAKNNLIFVQDDDCFVNYQRLFKHYNGQITHTITPEHMKFYSKLDCTLVGWGAYFTKDMIDNAFEDYIAKYGEDKYLLREADRIFTYFNRPFNTILQPHENLIQTGDKMSLQPEHYDSMYKALEQCKAMEDEIRTV
jgi:hypothetical protein